MYELRSYSNIQFGKVFFVNSQDWGTMEKAGWHLLFLLYLNVVEESFRLCALMDCVLLPENTAAIYGVIVLVNQSWRLCFSSRI